MQCVKVAKGYFWPGPLRCSNDFPSVVVCRGYVELASPKLDSVGVTGQCQESVPGTCWVGCE
eukprot:569243-Hanusia_phi.AAC.1